MISEPINKIYPDYMLHTFRMDSMQLITGNQLNQLSDKVLNESIQFSERTNSPFLTDTEFEQFINYWVNEAESNP